MAERPTIAFRVDEAQKERWTEYAGKNPEYDSLSHLIRTAVAHEMSDAYGPLARAGSESSGGQGGTDERVGELLTAVNRMEDRLTDVEDTVEDASEVIYETTASGPSAGEVLGTLYPTSDLQEVQKTGDGDYTSDFYPERGKTALDIAEQLDTSVELVERALKQLHARRELVKFTEKDGVKFWHRSEPV